MYICEIVLYLVFINTSTVIIFYIIYFCFVLLITLFLKLGAASWFFIYPIDFIKTKYQLDNGTCARKVIIKLYKNHGLRIFYSGCGVAVARAFPVNAIVFYCYETFKNEFGI